MKYIFFFILIYFSFCCAINGQNNNDSEMKEIRKNSIYFEILGNGVLYSINYDRILPIKNKLSMFIRIGGNEYHGESNDELSFNLIGATGILFGGPKHLFETSVGYTHFMNETDRLIVFTGGYRFQGSKGLLIRTTPMYIYNAEKETEQPDEDSFGNSIYFGLSVGYSF